MFTAATPPGPHATQNAVHPLSEMSPNANAGLSRSGRLAWLLAEGDVVDITLADDRRAQLPVVDTGTPTPDTVPGRDENADAALTRNIVLGNATQLGGLTSETVTLSSTVAYASRPADMPPYKRAPITAVNPLGLTSVVDDRIATTGIEDLTILQNGHPERRRPAQLTLIGRLRHATADSDVIAALMRDGQVGLFPALANSDDVPDADPLRVISLDTYRTELDAGVLVATDETTTAFNQLL